MWGSFVVVQTCPMWKSPGTFITLIRLLMKVSGVHVPNTVSCCHKSFRTKLALKVLWRSTCYSRNVASCALRPVVSNPRTRNCRGNRIPNSAVSLHSCKFRMFHNSISLSLHNAKMHAYTTHSRKTNLQQIRTGHWHVYCIKKRTMNWQLKKEHLFITKNKRRNIVMNHKWT